MSDLKIQGEVSLSTENAETALNRVGDKAGQMANRLQNEAGKAGKAVDGIGAGAIQSAEQFSRAEGRIAASIKRATTSLEQLGKTASQKLEFQISERGLDTAKFEPALAKLRELEKAQTRVGVSAAQMQAALRGVPAQFTDIVTSLQGGQQPMTVLLQQGGQLKDMFGGAGNAAKALGGYVLGLINPFTVAAAAGVTLALAYKQGSDEAQELSKALILSGNAAGTSVNQLQNVARSVANATGATRGAVTESLAQLAGTGKVSADVIGTVAEAAVRMERLAGKAIKDTVKEFAELGKSPVDASLKLNDQYNYLTASVYKQIKALEDQGKTAEAAALAQKSYADALNSRSKELAANLGLLETAWHGLSDGAKRAWDSMLGVGREATLEQKIASQVKYLQDLRNGPFAVDTTNAEKTLTQLQIQLEQKKRLAAQEADYQKAQKAGIDLMAMADKNLSKEEEKRKALARAAEDYRVAVAGAVGDQARMLDLAQAYEKAVAGINRPDDQALLDNRLSRLREALSVEVSLIQTAVKLGTKTELAGIEEAKAARIKAANALIEVLNEKYKTAQSNADPDGIKTQIAKERDEIRKAAADAKVQERELDQRHQALLSKFAAMATDSIAPLQAAWQKFRSENAKSLEEAQLNGWNDVIEQMGQAWASVVQKTNFAEAKAQFDSLFSEMQQKIEAIRQVSEAGGGILAGIAAEKEVKAIKGQYIPALDDLIAKMREAKGENPMNEKSVTDAVRATQKAANEIAPVWSRFTADIERSLTDSIMRGFENGKSFAQNLRDSVVNMFKTMVLRPIVQAIVQPVVGGALSLAGMGQAAASGGGSGAAGSIGAINAGASLYSIGSSIYGYGQAAAAGSALTSAQAAAAANAYYSAGYYGTGAAIQAGGAAGAAGGSSALTTAMAAMPTAAAVIAAAAISYYLNKKISDGYSISQSSEGKNTMAWVGAIGGVINRAFGMRARQIDAQGIEGDFTGNGFSGRSFEDWSQKGGWFRSNRSGTNYGALSADQQSALNTAAASMAVPFLTLQAAGGGDPLTDQLKAFKYSVRKSVSSEADVTALIKDVSDALGKELLPQLERWQQKGEALADTAKRLGDIFGATNTLATILGKDMKAAFGALGIASAEVRQALVDSVGGLDSFKSQVQSFYQTYFSQEEQFSRLKSDLSEQFTALGLALPASKKGFRDLVESLDLTTYAGQKTFGVLMNAQQAFSEFIDGISNKIADLEGQRLNIAQNVVSARDQLIRTILTSLGKTGALRSMDLANVDPLNRELARLSYALEDAHTAAQAMAEAQSNLAQAQSNYASGLINAGSGIADFVRSLRSGVTQSATGAAGAYRADLAAARAGNVAASQRLPASAQAYLEAIKKTATSQTEIDIAMTRMAADLEALPATQSYAEQQAKTLRDISDTLEKNQAEWVAKSEALNRALVDVLTAGFGAFDTSLDGVLTFDELKAGLSGIASDEQIRALIQSVDKNGDGQISKLEMVNRATAAVDDNTAELIDGSDSQINEMRRMVAETIVNSGRMMELNASIQALKNEVAVQNAEKKRQAELSAADLTLESLAKQKEGMVGAITAGIKSIQDLATKYGVTLLNSFGGAAAFGVDQNGQFSSDYNAIGYTPGRENDVVAFRNAFYSAGGAYDQTYGMADDLLGLKAKIEAARQAVRDLGGIPKFATGGAFSGGLRLVGEQGPELEVTGPSRIYNFDQTRALLNKADNSAELVSEIRALREDNRAQARAIATLQSRLVKIHERWDGTGIPETRVTA